MMRPITVVYVAAEEDKPLLKKLEAHLALLEQQGKMQGWHTQPILAGSVQGGSWEEALKKASLVLLLISADFFASPLCREQMEQALERQRRGAVRVIPLLLRAVDGKEAPFVHLKMLPTNGVPITSWANPEEAFAEVAEEIRRVIEAKPLPVFHEKKEAATYNANNQQASYGQTIGEHNTVHQQHILPVHSTGSWMAGKAEERQKIKVLFLVANPKSTN